MEILNNELNNNNANTNDDSVSIYDCFEQFVQPAIMNGDNMMFCNKCQQLSITSYTTKIYSSAKILILILNRGKGNEFKVKINFEKIISIGKYVELNKEEELKYELYAVLTHLGTSDMSGHFIAFCYSIIDKIWYKFNDAFVDSVNDFQKEIEKANLLNLLNNLSLEPSYPNINNININPNNNLSLPKSFAGLNIPFHF